MSRKSERQNLRDWHTWLKAVWRCSLIKGRWNGHVVSGWCWCHCQVELNREKKVIVAWKAPLFLICSQTCVRWCMKHSLTSDLCVQKHSSAVFHCYSHSRSHVRSAVSAVNVSFELRNGLKISSLLFKTTSKLTRFSRPIGLNQ